MAQKETFSRGTKVGFLGGLGNMGSTRNDYNQVDTSYLLHNVILLEKKNFSEFIGHLFEKNWGNQSKKQLPRERVV